MWRLLRLSLKDFFFNFGDMKEMLFFFLAQVDEVIKGPCEKFSEGPHI